MSLVKNLNVRFSSFSVEIPSWEIPDQGITVLWGPSGSGKSTVLRTLIGLEPCSSLSWNFRGQDLAQLKVPERKLGVVFQTLELFPHLSAEKNIWFAAEARNVEISRAQKTLQHLVAMLQLGKCLKTPAHQLSGGETQRVALARALIGEPRLLLLDEPFSSLDSSMKREARALVRQTIGEFQIPTLLITHDSGDFSELADSHQEIADGKLT